MDLRILARIESLITQREGMIALNTYRSHLGQGVAYSDEHFFDIAAKLDEIFEATPPTGGKD